MPTRDAIVIPTRQVAADLAALDGAVYTAVATTPTPRLDKPLRVLSIAANRSQLWFGIALLLAVTGGRRGRRAALLGVASIAVTSPLVNLGMKLAGGRPRPDRGMAGVGGNRRVRMPGSLSFPSGHAASGYAFAASVEHSIPALGPPIRALAGTVAYSRVHTGVHYPGDAVVGAMAGSLIGRAVAGGLSRLGV